MSIRRQVEIVRRWLLLIVASMVVGGTAAFVVTAFASPTYTARVGVIVAPPLTSSGATLDEILLGQALAPTYAQLATARPLLEKAIAATPVTIDPDALANDVTTVVPPSSNLLYVSVKYKTAVGAAELANAIAAQLVDRSLTPASPAASPSPAASAASSASPSPAASAASSASPSPAAIVVSVIEPAVPPTRRSSSGALSSAVLGATIGLLLSASAAFLVENLGGGSATAAL